MLRGVETSLKCPRCGSEYFVSLGKRLSVHRCEIRIIAQHDSPEVENEAQEYYCNDTLFVPDSIQCYECNTQYARRQLEDANAKA